MARRLLVPALLLALCVVGGIASQRPVKAETGNPLERFGLSEGTPRALTGRVVERLPAGPYTYLRVRTDAGPEHWGASISLGPTAVDEVVVKVIADAPTFESRRLSRTFSPLLFGVIRDAAQPPSMEPK